MFLNLPLEIKNKLNFNNKRNKHTENGSACSHDIGAPQDAGLNFSGRDSGTATIIKKTSRMATAEAKATTKLSLYSLPR